MRLFIFSILSLLSQSGFAEWTLVNHASSFNYFSIKADKTEVNSFTNMTGSISKQGYVNIWIDLSSIETHNSQRNLLIQDLFLETKNFNEGTISTSLGTQFLDVLEYNKTTEVAVTGVFMLHGALHNVNIKLALTRLKNDFLVIRTYEPIILELENYDLSQGLKRLKRVKSFEYLSNKVPVSFNMFFSHDGL